ncbi:zinc finger BED domain-containing protein 4-like [Eublepharis macularius]|uniref:Zinc finger BED domain-containing protein 4-like n=1 Tax=Eublepharis macularius TaxID=481883 RepID=A0AA97JU42_EUBMA|nr:zinc finger BED domain-containing protein 4-like [Eublepharis macularius]XP_054844276.1 zinc finger BED domain-containing protein 4-like [Eublepharis macularius]
MSKRRGVQRGPGGKVKVKTRGLGGRGRDAVLPPPARRRTAPTQLSSTSPAPGLAGESKRPRKVVFAEAAAGAPPPQVPEAGAGTGQGLAAEAPSPTAVMTQQCEEDQHEMCFGVDLGDASLPIPNPGTPGMLEERSSIGEPSPVSSEASCRSFQERQEQSMEVTEEEEVEAVPSRVLPSQLLCSRPSPSAPTRQTAYAPSASQEAAPGVSAAAGQHGCHYSSAIWDHFQKMEDPSYAQCQLCQAQISPGKDRAHFLITRLRNHLKNHHQEVLLQEAREAGAAQLPASQERSDPMTISGALPSRSPVGGGGQGSLTEMFSEGGTNVPRGEIQRATKRVTWHIAEMITVDGHPFSIVEDIGFRGLLQEVCPWYSPPARTTLSRTVVPSLYRTVKEYVRAQLSHAAERTVHFTSDIWTCPQSQHEYLSLTAHWWQPDDLLGGGGTTSAMQGQMGDRRAGYRHALLHAEVLEEAHTVANISAGIKRQLEDWVGRNVTMGYMVTNSGKNITAAAEQVGLNHISCVAHKLHLVVRDALGLGLNPEDPRLDTATREFQCLIMKCRHIASHFLCSVKAIHQLRLKQILVGVPEHHLISDISTCWNSTYAMLERLVEQQTALTMQLSENGTGRGESQFSQEEWLTISQTVEVLKPFKDYTIMASSETATLGLVIPLVHALQNIMTSFLNPDSGCADLVPAVRAFVRRLQQGIMSQLQPITEKELYMLATMCDPRIKGTFAERAGKLSSLREALSVRVWHMQARRGTLPAERTEEGTSSANPCPAPSQQVPLTATSEMSLEMKLIARALEPSGNVRHANQDLAAAVVREYLSEPCESLSTDPLSYWAQKEAVWPDLSLEAQRLLSCPPTIFSHVGGMVSPHHTHLPPWRVEQLVFLRVNLPRFSCPLDFQSE